MSTEIVVRVSYSPEHSRQLESGITLGNIQQAGSAASLGATHEDLGQL